MNITPVNYNQNYNRTKNQSSSQTFGTLKAQFFDKSLFDVLCSKFPIGTNVQIKNYKYNHFQKEHARSEAYIDGLTQAAENKIAEALKAANLLMKTEPHRATGSTPQLLAGLKALGVSDLEPGQIIKSEEEVISRF